jgi:hypothetical protein
VVAKYKQPFHVNWQRLFFTRRSAIFKTDLVEELLSVSDAFPMPQDAGDAGLQEKQLSRTKRRSATSGI